MSLRKKLEKHRLQEAGLMEAVKAAFMVGRMVQWQHGQQMRMGEIVDYRGMRLDTMDFKVKSIRNRTYWVSAFSIIAAND